MKSKVFLNYFGNVRIVFEVLPIIALIITYTHIPEAFWILLPFQPVPSLLNPIRHLSLSHFRLESLDI